MPFDVATSALARSAMEPGVSERTCQWMAIVAGVCNHVLDEQHRRRRSTTDIRLRPYSLSWQVEHLVLPQRALRCVLQLLTA